MHKFLAATVVVVLTAGSAAAADVKQRRAVYRQAPQVLVVQDRGPLGQIPVVGTVVFGGLNYAGALIMSPLELVGYRPPQYYYYR